MTTDDLITVKEKAENAYALINELISNHSIDMIDLAYPEHDGVQDAEVISEMLLLRQSVHNFSIACGYLVDKLTDVIGDDVEK